MASIPYFFSLALILPGQVLFASLFWDFSTYPFHFLHRTDKSDLFGSG